MRHPGGPSGLDPTVIRVLTLAFLIGAVGCSDGETKEVPADTAEPTLLPMALHGMPVTAVATGPDAEALIRRLHGKDVASQASYMAQYEGGGATATLYVSRFGSPALAHSIAADMSEALGVDNRTFAHHEQFDVDAILVHAVVGQGQAHFFFARGPDVVWLAVDYDMARIALADLLGVSMTRVPDGLIVGGIDILPPPDSLYPRPGLDAFVRQDRR